MEERCVEEMVRGREDSVERERNWGGERERRIDRHESEGEHLDRATGGARRARGGRSFTDDHEMVIIEFVKEHCELYTR